MPQEMTGSAPVSPKMTVARWLFNPFIRIAGPQALGIGLAVIVLSGLVAAAGGVRFEGLLDFHLGYATPFWVPVVEGLVNWSVIAALFGLVSLLVAPRTVRLVDVAGTQALARWPLLPAALVCILPAVRRGNEEMIAAAAQGRLMIPQGWVFGAGLFASICGIWMVWLMWKAFAVSCNQRGGRAVAIFAAAVLAGEVATKFLWVRMFSGLSAAAMAGGS